MEGCIFMHLHDICTCTLRPRPAIRNLTAPPTAAELAEYAGRYYSAELETSYTLAVANGKLVAKHRRLEDIELTPRAKDEFRGNAWFFGNMVVERDGTGGIKGFRVSNGRVRNLSFARER